MTIDDPLFPVLGLGASAGGVQAIEEFFAALQSDPGIAIVIITHLSPDRDSLLHEIVARSTPLPVFVAEDRMRVAPNCVYVMPPNAIMTIEEGRLRLRLPNRLRRERNPIDLFLSSLALERGDHAAAIILSGGGSDGSLGVKAIREHGGITLAQTSDGTKPVHDDMPASAIATGLVDHAVPVQEMPAKLIAFRDSLRIDMQIDTLSNDAIAVANKKRAYDALRKQTGHDFSGYKIKTFMRRVERRMHVRQMQDFDAYVTLLENDHEEVTQLFRDLLINVTNFFRDADAFDILETTIIPRLFEGRGADDTVRVWVPGCATGEEVFSIGMLIREHIDTLKAMPRVQIFATDIDDSVLLVARAARYPEPLLDGVSPARRRRFFVKDGGTYVVSKEVRDLCIFSPHSVIRDPPFSRIDLVSCRNLLIYLGVEIQNQVIPIFHYALRPGGYLFLGTSENVGDFGDLFAAVDKKQRIFQMRDHGANQRLPMAMYGTRTPPLVLPNGPSPSNIPLRHAIEARIIDRFAPAHVVVNGDGDVVYVSQHTGKYLEVAHGPPSRQLLAMARRGLRLDLRSALHEVADSRQMAVRNNIVIDDDPDDILMVRLTVDPIRDRDSLDTLFLVLFEDVALLPSQPGNRPQDRDVDDAVALLERDLRDTRERLQSMMEEYETAIEELKSSNEELVSVNEELQSTNEEMEASKEELQSLNEELQTVNIELTGKLDDLDRANADLKNLFESTQIATVFLDRDLVIRSFTPAISRIFRLIPSDRGRPLTDFAIHSAYPLIQEHVRQVFETGESVEHRIAEPTYQVRYLVRLIPYRSSSEHIEGVVVTFVDITSLIDLEDEHEILTKELNHRAANGFAVIGSIVRHLEAPDIEAFRTAAISRLQLLGTAYELVRRDRPSVPLEVTLVPWLEPFGSARFAMDGPSVLLSPIAGRSFGRIVQELATNAAKYGAFSNATGRVSATWTVGDRGLVFRWNESEGPEIRSVGTSGFGLKLIERESKIGLYGASSFDFRREGLAFTLGFAP